MIAPYDDSVWQENVIRGKMQEAVLDIEDFERMTAGEGEYYFVSNELESVRERIAKVKSIGFDILYSRKIFLEQSAVVRERVIDLNEYRVSQYGDKNKKGFSRDRDKMSGKMPETYSIVEHFFAIVKSLHDMKENPDKYKVEMADENFRKKMTDFLIAENKLKKIHQEFKNSEYNRLFLEAVKELELPGKGYRKEIEDRPKKPGDQKKVLSSDEYTVPVNRQAVKALTKGKNI